MTPYRDVSGKSGIESYEIRDRSILIRFKHSRTIYVYDYDVPGQETVEEMKQLAEKGHDLSSFISRVVKKRYSKQI